MPRFVRFAHVLVCGALMLVAASVSACASSAPRPASRHAIAGMGRATLTAALARLQQVRDSGGLALLRTGHCVRFRSNSDERCRAAWSALDELGDLHAELASSGSDPEALEPLHSAIERLSPDPSRATCTAAPDALVRAQAAVLRLEFELELKPEIEVAADAAPGDFGCLEVATLGGHVRVVPSEQASAQPVLVIGSPVAFRAPVELSVAASVDLLESEGMPNDEDAVNWPLEPRPNEPFPFVRAVWLATSRGRPIDTYVIAFTGRVWRVVAIAPATVGPDV